MTVEQRIEEQSDHFPVGLRVLAVDDDPTCLKLLETLLRKCQYYVTTTNQAVVALEMLRENKNKFDLVISDVHMPDMDGFKLLELVGLEMDLPVIMLSSYGDTRLVMKGITHGACDYLLKPVRIEELKNIWQHVIRRKKFDPKDQKHFEKTCENGEVFAGVRDSDQNGKLNRKRKDQDVEDEDEHDESGLNAEDPSTQKKARVVWSVDLHRKFVAAVNQLGIDKAVPKRILDLMNVEKLTRENVASHLQKYRLYLKRISCVATQQVNMVAAFGRADSGYLRMGSLAEIGNLPTLPGSVQIHNDAFRSFSSPAPTILGRLNTAASLGVRGLPSTGMCQFGFAQNFSNPVNDLTSIRPVIQPTNPNGGILCGIPLALGPDQLQNPMDRSQIGEPGMNKDPMAYPITNGFSGMKIDVCSSNNCLFDVPGGDPILLKGQLQNDKRSGVVGNQSARSDLPSYLPDLGRCNDDWACAVDSCGVVSESFTPSQCYKQSVLTDSRDDISSMAMHVAISSPNVSAVTLAAPIQLPDSRPDLECGDNPRENLGFNFKQGWDYHKQDSIHHPNLRCSSINSSSISDDLVNQYNPKVDLDDTFCHENNDLPLLDQSNCASPLSMQHNVDDQTAAAAAAAAETMPKLIRGYLHEQRKEQGNYAYSYSGSLEDVVGVMMK